MNIELTEEEIKTILKIREERARREAEKVENENMIDALRKKIEETGLFGHLHFRFDIMESGPCATARTHDGRNIKISGTSTGKLNIQIGALGWSTGICTSLEEFLNIYSNLRKARDLKAGDYYVAGENLQRLNRPLGFIKVGAKHCLSDEFRFEYCIETYEGRIATDEEFNCDDICYTESDRDGEYTTLFFGDEARKKIDQMIGRA